MATKVSTKYKQKNHTEYDYATIAIVLELSVSSPIIIMIKWVYIYYYRYIIILCIVSVCPDDPYQDYSTVVFYLSSNRISSTLKRKLHAARCLPPTLGSLTPRRTASTMENPI